MRVSSAFVEFPRSVFERSVPARFDEIARRHPTRSALESRGRVVTYADLAAEANRLAHAILGRCGPGPEPIALLFDHDASAVAAILGVLKAGKFCVVLDGAQPHARLAAMVDDAETRLVVHGAGRAGPAAALASAARDVLDSEGAAGLPTTPPPDAGSPRALAYISYTAGTTGTPKGVLADHRGIIHRAMAYVNTIRVGPGDRLALLHGLGVGASFRQLWGGLLSGATVCLFDLRREGVAGIGEWLHRERITLPHFPASAFRHFAAGLTTGASFPDVRALTVSNEPVFPRDLELFRRHFPPDSAFVIMLGASEAGNVTQQVIESSAPPVADLLPIGFPLPDKEILLLGDDGAPVAAGEVGEIAVRSEFLSPGYWRRPELDRAAFLADPDGGDRRIYRTGDLGRVRSDGALLHLGRKDAIPKLRGQFVDAREVEQRLLGHRSVADVVVAIREDRAGDQRLVAYVVPAPGVAPTATELRQLAEATLPAHIVPSLFVLLPALPRTANGKVDRRALPPPPRARPALAEPFVAPRTSIERHLASIWADVLGLDEVGVDDDFFDLGGHSLLAARLGNRVRADLGVDLPLPALLRTPTVAAMAALIVEWQVAALSSEDRQRLLDPADRHDDEAGDKPPA